MARRWTTLIQKIGWNGAERPQLDPIRSEYPVTPGSGFVAQASAVSANLVLSVPSGFYFQIKWLYLNAGTVGSVIFYDGGSAASLNTTVFNAFIPSVGSSPGVLQLSPVGLYVQSLLFASMGAASQPAIKVGGYLFDQSAAI